LTDGGGVPLGVAIGGANRPDYQLARETLTDLQRQPVVRPEPTAAEPQGLCVDQGYDYDPVYELVEEFGYTAHVRPWGSGSGIAELTPEEAQAAGVKARRWVVERTHSWLNRFRALLIRWNKKPQNYLALLHFACALITYRAVGLLR
jgi:putative transposase